MMWSPAASGWARSAPLTTREKASCGACDSGQNGSSMRMPAGIELITGVVEGVADERYDTDPRRSRAREGEQRSRLHLDRQRAHVGPGLQLHVGLTIRRVGGPDEA